MDRQEKMKAKEGSENGSENGSNDDSDSEDKVCGVRIFCFFSPVFFICCNFFTGLKIEIFLSEC